MISSPQVVSTWIAEPLLALDGLVSAVSIIRSRLLKRQLTVRAHRP